MLINTMLTNYIIFFTICDLHFSCIILSFLEIFPKNFSKQREKQSYKNIWHYYDFFFFTPFSIFINNVNHLKVLFVLLLYCYGLCRTLVISLSGKEIILRFSLF